MSLSKIAKKHLGQNFLIDDNIKNRIIDTAQISSSDTILEIGPGRGALTERLLKKKATVYAIEKDPGLISYLHNAVPQKDFHLIHHDILTFDFSSTPKLTKIIGNIPYNISSPIIETLITNRAYCSEIFLTTQLEFGQRLSAKPNSKNYGSLTCFVQYFADVNILFKINPGSFKPIPKVMSCFLRISFHEPAKKAKDEKLLFRIIRTAFSQRRKKIENTLCQIIDKKKMLEILKRLKIASGKRADHLHLSDYIAIADMIATYSADLNPHSNPKTNAEPDHHA